MIILHIIEKLTTALNETSDSRIGLGVDDTYSGLTLPPSQSRVIWLLAWSSLPSFLYAYYRGHTELSLVPLSVYSSSMIYWYCPIKYSWIHYLDIGVVLTSCMYQCIKARNAENAVYFYPVLFIGTACFPLSTYVRKTYPTLHIGHVWIAIILHGLIHVIGNVANFILYCGKI